MVEWTVKLGKRRNRHGVADFDIALRGPSFPVSAVVHMSHHVRFGALSHRDLALAPVLRPCHGIRA